MQRPAEITNATNKSALGQLAWLGFAMMLIFGALSLISQPFEYGETASRPILAVVGLLISATALSIFAVRAGMQAMQNSGPLLLLIASMAIGFRIVMCFTPPVLEIDFYRYLWDGKVAAAGVSPYGFSPQQVIDAGHTGFKDSDLPQDLEKLATLSLASTANHEILTRVHFPNHTTIYPPVSQFAFLLAAKLTPADASLTSQVFVMRTMLVMFDLGTIVILLLILKAINRNVAWLIAYAWNPLVIKEISNSIHLDSIAIFFMMTAVLYIVLARNSREGKKSAALGGLSLGLAVGAKLFPIVIAPAIAAALLKSSKAKAAVFSIAFIASTAAVLYPMVLHYDAPRKEARNTEAISPEERSLMLLQQQSNTRTQDVASETANKDGLTSFLSSWRMNDAIFSTVYQNLRPNKNPDSEYWYVIVPNQIRTQIGKLEITRDVRDPAFFITRIITLATFAVIYLCFLPRFYSGSNQQFLNGLLFILFAFLLLQPTVNPWYWVWAIPFTCFTSRWGWIGISAVLTVYYTRFFFETSDLAFTFNQHSYEGVAIFDHFVVWGEAILIALAVIFSGKLDAVKSPQQISST